ncbi:MAG: alkaline phosphatase family protein [Promethearchaeati archaeon SRVP18_Atabeyarchaeia-1]
MCENIIECDKGLVKEAEITPSLFKPNYKRCIHMVLPTALSFLGFRLPTREYSSLTDTARLRRTMENNSCFDSDKVIMVVADSVGIEQFRKSSYLSNIYNETNGFQLSSVFPTITSTALASIHMATPPGIHGIFGHKIFFKELGAVVDTLKMSTLSVGARDSLIRAGIDARALTYCSSPYDLVEQQGIEHVELLEDEIAGTGLSNMIYRRQVARGFNNLIDAFSMARQALEEEKDKKVMVNLYTGILDSLSHKYGPYSEEYSIGMRFLDENIRRLVGSIRDSTAEKTTLVFLADHGQDPIDPRLEIVFSRDEIEKLGKFLRAPAGKSGRVMHFYVKDGFQEDTVHELKKKVGERGYLVTFEDAIRTFVGKTMNLKMSKMRLGDIILILKKGVNVEIRRDESQNRWEEPLRGSHGSMTLNELLVPFISVKLSQLKKY